MNAACLLLHRREFMHIHAQPIGGELAQGASVVANCWAALHISPSALPALATSNHHSSITIWFAHGPPLAPRFPPSGLVRRPPWNGSHYPCAPARAGILQPLTVADFCICPLSGRLPAQELVSTTFICISFMRPPRTLIAEAAALSARRSAIDRCSFTAARFSAW